MSDIRKFACQCSLTVNSWENDSHAFWGISLVNNSVYNPKLFESTFIPLWIRHFIVTISHLTEDLPVFTSYNGQWLPLTQNDMKSLANDIFIRTSWSLDNGSEYCRGSAFHGNIFAPWHLTSTLCQMAAGVVPCLLLYNCRASANIRLLNTTVPRVFHYGPNSFNFARCVRQ